MNREEENKVLIEQMNQIQTKSDSFSGDLAKFMEKTCMIQDKAITVLKNVQEAMDVKLTTISNYTELQMKSMSDVLMDFNKHMIGLADGKSKISNFEQQQNAIAELGNDSHFLGNQRNPLGGGSITDERLNGDREKRGEESRK